MNNHYASSDSYYQFTSESVSEGHPDKVADLISDAIATRILNGNERNRAAVETMVTTNRVVVGGEFKTDEYKAHSKAFEIMCRDTVRDVIRDIGYEQEGFNWMTVNVENHLHGQSADIALGTDDFGAGDQGLMFGYATNENPETEYMPSTIYYSHKILKRLAHERRNGETWLGPDSKSQVTGGYHLLRGPISFDKIVCSTQHSNDVSIQMVRDMVEDIIRDEIAFDNHTELLVNPTGNFVIGGPDGDTGLTGRKIIVDTYGGSAPHGGGAFSGKDPTKVDRSAAYMARYLARNLVSSGKVRNALVQLSYAIGVKEPTSVYVYADGKVRMDLANWFKDNVDLTPLAIIRKFDLFNLDLTRTTNYGHFGRPDLPWEQDDLF